MLHNKSMANNTRNNRSWALSLIYRYLEGSGLHSTLEMLKTEACNEYEDMENAILPSDKPLLALLEDLRIDLLKDKMESVALNKNQVVMAQPVDGKYIKTLTSCHDNVHYANILCVLSCRLPATVFTVGNLMTNESIDGPMDSEKGCTSVLISGSTDQTVKITGLSSGKLLHTLIHHESPVLAIDQHPKYKHVLLTASMDGQLFLMDLRESSVLQQWQDHSKYIVRAAFSIFDEGKFMVTASYDKTVNIYRNHDNPGVHYTLVHKMTFKGPVESICFVPPSNSMRFSSLVVGVREDNYLHYVELTGTFPYSFFNMNANGDDWISFTPMHLSLSPNQQHLLCYTNSSSGRLIVFRTYSSEQITNLYGPMIDEYSQPRCCWDPSGNYIYATSDDFKVWVIQVGTGKVMDKLEGHVSVIRSLTFDEMERVLVTGSFDKKMLVFKYED